MLQKKEGYPEEDEILLCSVTGVNPHSVFCTLDEYGGKRGMIHISEVAPGRIRNIREYVQEGKKVVVKVLRVNKEKGHIDLSLRRVGESQRRKKLNEIKQEQLAEKIIELVSKQQKQQTKTLYDELCPKLLKEYDSLYAAFEDVSKGNYDLSKVIDKKTADALTDAIQQRIKPPEAVISGEMRLMCYREDGAEQVKNTLISAEKEGLSIRYLGAGRWHAEIKTEDFKTAEKILKNGLDKANNYARKHAVKFQFLRKE